ncbi:MAG: ribulose-phosphate 3-epimerase [Phycisphaerales bacterium JB058]
MPRDLLRNRPIAPVLAPSILAADFADLASDARSAMASGGSLLHLDVMDAHFVPNLSFGPGLCASLRKAMPDVCFDVHLMIKDPASYLEPFQKAGADHISFHIEVLEPAEAVRLADRTRKLGCTAGIAINPETPFDRVEPVLGAFDMLLIMSVHPGFGGQAFIPDVLDKVRQGRKKGPDGLIIEIDGGVAPDTGPSCVEAGCDILVAGSALFGLPDDKRAEAVRNMLG